MRTVITYLAAVLLLGIGIDASAQGIMTDKRCGVDASGTVISSVVIPSAEEKQLLQDLDEVRVAGDFESSKALQVSLDRLHGKTSNISNSSSAIQEPPVIHSGKMEQEPSSSFLWGGDVLITDPAIGMVKPSMIHTPDGVLYAAVEVQSNNNIRIYRSTDGGATWTFIYWTGGGDDLRNPSVAYGENASGEVLYVGFEVLSGTQHGVNVLHLDVNTLSAYNTYVVWGFTMPGSEQVYPKICTDSLFYNTYYIYVTYAVSAIDYYPVMFSRSTDHGVTYTVPANITGGAENSSWPTRPDITFGTSGLFVAFEKKGWNGSTWSTQPWVTESNNYGSSFSVPVQLAASTLLGYHPAVAAAPDDSSIVVAYTKEFTTDLDIYYAYSIDGGSNWTTENFFPWTYDDEKAIDLCTSDSNGRFHAAYYQDFNNVVYTYANCSSPSSWAAGTVVNDTQSASNTYPWPSVCVNPTLPLADEGCIAWTDFRGVNYGAYFDKAPIPPLSTDSGEISASSGGMVNFFLNAGASNAGRHYLLLGSASGINPGTALPGGYATLPLNWDALTDLVLAYVNTPLFANFLGALSGSGQSQAQLNAPPLDPIYVGLLMNYAFCLNNYFDFVSNPVYVEIVF
ncbi:MAG: sialidase family protein [Planctomycetota bacterium]